MARQPTIKFLGLIMAGVALVAVVINELHPFQSNSIYLLLAAGIAAILPYLDSFKAGGVEVNLRELIQGKMDEVKQEVQTQASDLEKKVEKQSQVVQEEVRENRAELQAAQSSLREQVNSVAAEAARAVKQESRMMREIGGVPGGARKVAERSFAAPETEMEAANQPMPPKPPSADANDAALQQLVRNINVPAGLHPDDDTWALVDQFKNLPEANPERALTAKVTPDEDDPDWYRIRLTLAPVGAGGPIVGRVYFLIHHTFPQTKIPVAAKDGHATLERYAYGAFTAVALADGGTTQLKLDLAELPDVPQGFAEG